MFAALFVLFAMLERAAPRRVLREGRGVRWQINLGLIVLNVLVQRLTLGALAITAAVFATERGWGLLAMVNMPAALRFMVGFLLLDLAVYAQHVATHHLPLLWRLHMVHHADLDLDVTSGLRFHPIEILLSVVYKALIVIAFGIDVWAVLVFEIMLNASSLFTHANMRVPAGLERVLRMVVCTPDMHRVHHSVIVGETNSNYGFFLSIWDRLFATYHAQPSAGHEAMEIGLEQYRDQKALGLWALLRLPFRRGG
jgi:sterol desaturase/sphingolipid hydroxylase (fatty acid hydroxylase superfamily)